MNLWTKPIDAITFEDVDQYLQQKLREGPQLDYKVDVAGDLDKLLAAFANTVGGHIILGVDEDKTTNEPVWPPTAGMPEQKGLQERIFQIAADAIHPPVSVELGRTLENESLPGHSIVVIRIYESPEAPHATQQGRRVYERTDNRSTPIDLAPIDRVDLLLNRRRRIEDQREAIVQASLERGRRVVRSGSFPTVWCSVIPQFPWRDVCTPKECDRFSRDRPARGELQTIPGGSFAIHSVSVPSPHGRAVCLNNECLEVSAKGHVLALEWLRTESEAEPLKLMDIATFLRRTLQTASDFYSREVVAVPGFITISLGLLNAYNSEMYGLGGGQKGKRYLDDSFRAGFQCSTAELLGAEFTGPSRSSIERHLLGDVAFGFDVGVPLSWAVAE